MSNLENNSNNVSAEHDKKNEAPVSSYQLQFWLIDKIHPGTSAYNIPSISLLKGQLNRNALERSINEIIKRHEIFRTTFSEKQNFPLQVIIPFLHIPLNEIDLSSCASEEKKTKLNQLVEEEINTPFDLEKGPLIRTKLFKLSDMDHALTITMHHIITDLHSKDLFVAELSMFYKTALSKQLVPLAKPDCQYSDYCIWSKDWLSGDESSKMLSFWRDRLHDKKQFLDFPIDRPYPPVQTLNGREFYFELSNKLSSDLKDFNRKEVVDVFVALLSAYFVLLYRYSGQTDITIGVPLTNRRRLENKDIMGCLMNILPISLDLSDDPDFHEVVRRIRKSLLLAHRNQELPLEKIVNSIKLESNPSYNPIFQYGFTFEPPMQLELYDLEIEPIKTNNTGSRLDMFAVMWEIENNFHGKLFYNSDIFDESTIKRFVNNYLTLLNSIISSPDIAVSRLQILSEQEKNLILKEWNNTEVDYTSNKCLHDFLEKRADITPGSIAVFFKDKTLTYNELNTQANKLAHHFISKGVEPGTRIGVCMERSIEMMPAIFAVLKAGCVYIPLDPSYPEERQTFIIDDAGIRVVLTQDCIYKKLQDLQCEFICLDKEWEWFSNHSSANPVVNIKSSDLAYIIYTSGSTGEPKGVMIEHRSVINRIEWMQKKYPIDKNDILLQKTPVTFDVSVWELFWWSFSGSSVCFLEPGGEKVPEIIINTIEKFNITVIHFVPSMLRVFLEYIKTSSNISRPLSLKQVFASGEALSLKDVHSFNNILHEHNGTKLTNLYGPTEATVDVSYFDCSTGEELNRVPIGKPIDNIKLYVVDNNINIQPIGVPGELVIEGAGLARGYLNKTELTEEKFISSPFSSKQDALLYKTGDMAKFMPDGNIEYLGRLDHQVKIRGYRIELGEIESLLNRTEYINEAVVLSREDNTGDKKLVAYVVPDKKNAYPVFQMVKLKDEEITNGKNRLELPNGMEVFYLNKNETEFMYQEIFENYTYLKQGIVLDNNACVFDVGANIGLFSLFINLISENANIYAFEPIPSIYDILLLNTSIYGTNINIYNIGLSNKNGNADFTYYPNASILSGRFANKDEELKIVKSFIKNVDIEDSGDDAEWEEKINELLEHRLSEKKYNCELKTISYVIKDNNITKIDLLKIDVEKGELDVLNGIEDKDWPKIKQLAIEIHDDERLKQISKLLEEKGFNIAVKQDDSLKNTNIYNIYAVSSVEQQHIKPDGFQDIVNNKANNILNSNILIHDLREYLKIKLPEYMIPSSFVILEKLPLSPNGKIDRKALLSIKPENKRQFINKSYVAPQNKIEEIIAGHWCELLGLEKVGIEDKFFDVGGNSFLALKLQTELSAQFNRKIEVFRIFEFPTIRRFTDYLKSENNDVDIINNAEKRSHKKIDAIKRRKHSFKRR